MGGLPHSILLQFIRRATSVNKRPVPANADTPLEERRRRTDLGGVAARTETCYAYGGYCSGRVCHFMAPHSGVFGICLTAAPQSEHEGKRKCYWSMLMNSCLSSFPPTAIHVANYSCSADYSSLKEPLAVRHQHGL